MPRVDSAERADSASMLVARKGGALPELSQPECLFEPRLATPQSKIAGPAAPLPPNEWAPRLVATPQPAASKPVVETAEKPAPAVDQRPVGPGSTVALVPARPRPAIESPVQAAAPTLPAAPSTPTAPTVAPVNAGWWPVPDELIAHLDRLQHYRETRPWSVEVRRRIDELLSIDDPGQRRVPMLLDELEDLAGQLNVMLPKMPEQPATVELRKAGVALLRRLDVWEQVPVIAQSNKQPDGPAPVDEERLAVCLNEIESLPDDATGDANLRQFLLLDRLRELNQRRKEDEPGRLRVAAAVLGRIEQLKANRNREHLASRQPLVRLHDELRRLVARPVDTRQMLAHIEQFERTGLPSDARLVADDFHRLAWSTGAHQQQLATAVATHYRNANLRISISADFLNRMMLPQEPRENYLRETVLGRPTRGHSTTWTEVRVQPIPDLYHARIAFEAKGRIAADTVTTVNFVRLRNHSDSVFVARKECELGQNGLQLRTAHVEAQTYPQLKGVDSSVDFVPVVGFLVHSVAESQYDGSQPKLRSEAQQKIERQVREEMDRTIAERIDTLNHKVRDNIIESLKQLDLAPELVDANSTHDRITMRVRLSGDEQLAGHGPRPRAPGDSLASIQIHQSLFNNICDHLNWEGKTLSLPQLREEVATRLGRALQVHAAEEHANLHITFARQDPVRVECRDGHIVLNLAIERLKLHRDAWHDFVVRVCYKPDLASQHAQIERDGPVQLIGDRLGPKAQIVLRSIFSKAFSNSKTLSIVPAGLTQRPGLTELRVSQFEIRDGWIGLAFDVPPTTAARSTATLK